MKDQMKHTKILQFYDISYKTSTGSKPLGIKFVKIDGFIRVCDGNCNFVLCNNGLFNKICDKIIYLIREKKGITDSINHNFGKIRISLYNSLPIEKNIDFCINTQ